jgi:hypothetical protein
MFITPFGEVKWKDADGMWQFLCAHDLKHQALAQVMVNAGIQPPAFLLSETVDDNWVQTHWQQHVLLSQILYASVDSNTYDLETNPMSDEETFYDWHDIHDQIHQQLDVTLGISGS